MSGLGQDTLLVEEIGGTRVVTLPDADYLEIHDGDAKLEARLAALAVGESFLGDGPWGDARITRIAAVQS